MINVKPTVNCLNLKRCLLSWVYFSTVGKFNVTVFLSIIYFPGSYRPPVYMIKLWHEPVIHLNKTRRYLTSDDKIFEWFVTWLLFLLGIWFLFVLHVMRLEMLFPTFILLDPMFCGSAFFRVKSYQLVSHRRSTFSPYMYGFILL